jgi:hypothetical protein
LLEHEQPNVVHIVAEQWPSDSKQSARRKPLPKVDPVLPPESAFVRPDRQIRLVVLDGCWVDVVAQSICNQVGCVVGTRDDDPRRSLEFVRAFYQQLFSGFSVGDAFQAAQIHAAALWLRRNSGSPQLLSVNVDPMQIYLINREQSVGRPRESR